jgi:hypothetical protein
MQKLRFIDLNHIINNVNITIFIKNLPCTNDITLKERKLEISAMNTFVFIQNEADAITQDEALMDPYA